MNTNALRRLCALGERLGMLTKRELDAELPYTLVFPRDPDEEELIRKYREEQAQRAKEVEISNGTEAASRIAIREQKRT